MMKGKRSGHWKGGKLLTEFGYCYIYSPEHQNNNSKGYVAEHRLVMEKKINRYLTKKEVVHHIDKNKLNNNIKNLMLFPNTAAHIRHHGLVNNQ